METMSDEREELTTAKAPCPSCPYRKSVPSGVWDATEYAKLPDWDGETFEQPAAVFMCHTQDGKLCAGWVGYRDPCDLLALRIGVARGRVSCEVFDYQSPVPLFASGAEAAAHGTAEIEAPGIAAQRVVTKIVRQQIKRGEQ